MSEIRTWTADEARAAAARVLSVSNQSALVDVVLAALGISGDVTLVPGRLEPAGVRDENGRIRPFQDAPLFRGDEPLYRVVPTHAEPAQP